MTRSPWLQPKRNGRYETPLDAANRNLDELRQQEETKRLRADPNSEYWVEQLEWMTERLIDWVSDYEPIMEAEYPTTKAKCAAYMEAVIEAQIKNTERNRNEIR